MYFVVFLIVLVVGIFLVQYVEFHTRPSERVKEMKRGQAD